MTSATDPSTALTPFPDHTQLPESNGTFVKNWQEHPQSILLTDSITPVLKQLHPDAQYCIGQDLGIYWRLTDPPEKGAEAPDWFYVPNVPPLLDGITRRSYVLWREFIAPLIVLEFVSGNGNEERDKTPWTGKFWIYEQVIRPPFYVIYEVKKASVEVYEFIGGQYQLLAANERGHYLIAPLGVELGIWMGEYQNAELPWLRWWDLQGNLLLSGEERAEQESQRAEQERQRADRLTAQLRSLGIEPEA
ncbi:Uma2 family endonuclease [Scytonema hofmannii FACHB-248]|uniref:Uma2 family endonuclease n=1 Tax=Scytonema hofmannii FACHB-248 TaxID=1842502 RepID=A0ABR8GHX4_9CYAN|nr:MULTISPECIES: Uma2 family endonuclease [Nostocales]MBD2602966.1 Uma2 family endonuclease [Scytonema hofmannii FACHB-248]